MLLMVAHADVLPLHKACVRLEEEARSIVRCARALHVREADETPEIRDQCGLV